MSDTRALAHARGAMKIAEVVSLNSQNYRTFIGFFHVLLIVVPLS